MKIQLVLLSIFFSLTNEKNKNRIEWYLWKYFFKDFERHPQVTDDRTNVQVGYGNGMARTSREIITFYKVLQKLKKNYGVGTAIDLGCGDGVALRYFEMSGFRSIGIEYDLELSEFARKNNPKSLVITGDITNSCVVEDALDLILPNNLGREKEYGFLVYAFNPITSSLLLESLNLFAKRSSYILLLKNPTSLPLLLNQENFSLKYELNNGNLAILEVEKF